MSLDDLRGEELLSLIPPHILAKQSVGIERVRRLCEEFGYGFVIGQASSIWRKQQT